MRNQEPRRSVFSNFKSQISEEGELKNSAPAGRQVAAPKQSASDHLQSAIDEAVACAFVYGFLAAAYEYPNASGWAWLSDSTTHDALRLAVKALTASHKTLAIRAEELVEHLWPDDFDAFIQNYVAAFGHAARGPCPLNEIEYGDLKADPLFQPHRLADLAAFYRAFGLEISEDADERYDHISIELEFMSVLAAKEAYALEHQLDDEQLAVCREAEKNFLREHLGRWSPAFTRRLARAVPDGTLGALARFTQEFLAGDSRRFGVTAGSEDLLLRPVDESSESLCASCGITSLPPGALAGTAQV